MQVPRIIANAPADVPTRTDYRDEVAKYLQDCHHALHLRAHTMIARWPGCALRLRLANPSDVDILRLVVRVMLPEDVRPIEPTLADTPPPGLPPRPVRRDTTSPPIITLHDVFDKHFGLVRRLAEVFPEQGRSFNYTIIDAETPTVELSDIDVPRKGSITLPDIPLMIRSPAGTDLSVRWTATGSTAYERFSGTVRLPITVSTLPLDGLLPST
jgi:hypothetical protein